MAKHSMNSAFLTLSLCALAAGPVMAADPTAEQTLVLKNHAFTPQEITVPANQKIKLIVQNQDDTAAEFESDELNREKVVPGNGHTVVYLDPLKAGTYAFYDDYHKATTTGKITVK